MSRILKIIVIGMACVWIAGVGAFAQESAPPAGRVFFVAPAASGAQDGTSEKDAANFRDWRVWLQVQRTLQNEPVTVNFLPGNYVFSKVPGAGDRGTLKLENMGNVNHQLVLQGMYAEGTVFMSDPAEKVDEKNTIDMFVFDGKNAVIRNLHFTGAQHMGYAARFFGENILVENCSCVDLTRVYYGATGTAYSTSKHITFKKCVFIRVGLGSHAHMIYNAYDPTYIYVIDSYFEDCAGEYVRFRDGTDYGVVFGNTFKSTGTFVNGNMPFISVPLFNDDDPSKPGANPNYEYFGTHFLVAHNTFIYPDDNSPGERVVMRFLHSGFDPPGRQHLLRTDDVRILTKGSPEQKRALLKQNMGIEGENVYIYDNTYIGKGSKLLVHYNSSPNYGAKGFGWSGAFDVTDAMNFTPVAATAAEAMAFWEK